MIPRTYDITRIITELNRTSDVISTEDIKSRYRFKTHPDCDTVDSTWYSVLLGTFVRLKGQCHEIFDLRFSFHESVSPTPLSIPLRPFHFFRKFAEIFAAPGLPLVSTTPVANGKNLQAE